MRSLLRSHLNRNMMKSNAALLSSFQLRQLAVMIDAGMPIDTALQSLQTSSASVTLKLTRSRNLVARGVSLPEALLRAKAIGQFDHAMLLAADSTGQVADGLKHISERQVNQLHRVDSLKASLVFPKAILFIGACGGIITRTASGYQSVAEACLSASLIVLWFYLVVYITLFIVRADTRIWMSWFWSYPTITKHSRWYCLALEYFFYNSFVWQVAGGVVASTATKGCSQLLSSVAFQGSVLSASRAMERGTSIGHALICEGLVLTASMRQVLLIADQSGTHEAAIKNQLKLQQLSLKQHADTFFKWTPRIFYLLALVLVSKLIIS